MKNVEQNATTRRDSMPQKLANPPAIRNSYKKLTPRELPDGAGATQPQNKSSEPDAVLRTGLQPRPDRTQVRSAIVETGVAKRCRDHQLGVRPELPGGNSNPKKRSH